MSQRGRAVLLAVGGGIAAYKSAVLCSRLAQAGHRVQVVMTESALQFVGVATFAALSGRPVATDAFDSGRQPLGGHIELAADVDLMIVAPATANLIGKFAHGIADDLLSTLYLHVDAPVLLAPAMSDAMWNKPSVTRNMTQVRADGCHVIGPESGWLSCRVRGDGRMSEPEQIAECAASLLGAAKSPSQEATTPQ